MQTLDSDQQHEHIKWLLRTRGSSLIEIARDLDVRPTAVTSVSKGRSRSRKIEMAIADATGLSPQQIWPQRYTDQEGV